MNHHLKTKHQKKGQDVTGTNFKDGGKCKKKSETLKITTVYQDYYFGQFMLRSCFPLYRYTARPITELYRTAKTGINRFIDISTQP